MRRVVVTGMGIVSSIGTNAQEGDRVAARTANPASVSARTSPNTDFRSQVWGAPTLDPLAGRPPRHALPVAMARAWNHVAMQQAIADAALRKPTSPTSAPASSWARAGRPPAPVQPPTSPGRRAARSAWARSRCPRHEFDRSATLATWFKIKGVNYSISSACSTSAHCIGNATELIQWGKQDMVFAGGGEDLDWTLSCLFDAMGAMFEIQRHAPRPRQAAPMTPAATAS
jgi:3-oxoacyl-[acyl-carrier-protein] synthase-1